MSKMYAIRTLAGLGCAWLIGCSGSSQHGQPVDGGDLDGSRGSHAHRDGSQSGDGDGDGDGDGSARDGGAARDGQVDTTLPDGSPFTVDPQGHVLCGDHPCACSNGLDDDGDNRDDACQDCFFDGNSGSGNDGCYLPTSCFTMGNDSSGHGRCSSCEQTQQCANFCQKYTPNGCDCFGCCEVRLANGHNVTVALGNGCNIDGNTVTGCNTCVQNTTCVNTCDRCELCPGKTAADLPVDCAVSSHPDGGTSTGGDGDGGSAHGHDAGTTPPTYTCGGGAKRCGSGLPACSSTESCEFGCCVELPPVILL